MALYIKSVENLINEFRKLPGIGPKSAKRIVFFLLKLSHSDIVKFSKNLIEMKEKVKFCSQCYSLTEEDICHICRDQSRDRKKICIVEEVSDVIIVEKTGEYKGLYHILGGLLSPIENVGPDEIRVPRLLERVKANNIEEVIIAVNPTVEGESTGMYLKKILSPLGVKVTKLASGIPVGGDLEYADEITIGRAISDRREL
ncbi:MAG: recombination protein RecR [Actinobacteria bacterium]|jgi:recombination protein RecR|nr:recombination protein RecR [Actinomycetota bacterium]MBE3113979.1 recombination protein RecR [Actinomycetota bacterium]